jgi:RNA polymerase sigma factor (sigma-70 family)
LAHEPLHPFAVDADAGPEPQLQRRARFGAAGMAQALAGFGGTKRLLVPRDCSGVIGPPRVSLVGQPISDEVFEAFFRAEYPMLCRALMLVAGDRSEAQDVAQEALARVYERWERVAAMESTGGYLYRVALNLQRKRVKRRARRVLFTPSSGEAADPADIVSTRHEVTLVLTALPIGQRQALVLTEWLGLDAAEAGEVLGIEASSVRVRVHRAKTALREQFGEADE